MEYYQFKPFPKQYLKEEVHPEQPYFVSYEGTDYQFDSLSEFLHWHGVIETIDWIWMIWNDLPKAIESQKESKEPRSELDDAIEAYHARGTEAIVIFLYKGEEYFFDINDPDRPKFERYVVVN